MPHIKDAEKDAVHASKRITKEGELCYLFTEAALKVYETEPRWKSIHAIARALFVNPYHEQWSHDVVREYAGTYTQQDVKTAAFLALLEFYRLVGARYEDGMIQQNGSALAGAHIPSLGKDVVLDRDNNVVFPPVETITAVVGVTEVGSGTITLEKVEVPLSPVQAAFQTPDPKPEVEVDANGDLTLKRGRGRPRKVESQNA